MESIAGLLVFIKKALSPKEGWKSGPSSSVCVSHVLRIQGSQVPTELLSKRAAGKLNILMFTDQYFGISRCNEKRSFYPPFETTRLRNAAIWVRLWLDLLNRSHHDHYENTLFTIS